MTLSQLLSLKCQTMLMMTSKQTGLSDDVLGAFRREELLAQGRHDAFLFALDCKGDVSRLRAEIQETEDTITNPPAHLKGLMTPNASPRVYKDGYRAGLKDALQIIEQAQRSPQPSLTQT